MYLEWSGDVRAWHVVPGDVDDSGARVRKSSECIWEEVEVVGTAAGAFVDNLLHISQDSGKGRTCVLTMAVTDLPA